MKKLLFVLVFTFIVFNATSQVMTLRVNVQPDYIDTTFIQQPFLYL